MFPHALVILKGSRPSQPNLFKLRVPTQPKDGGNPSIKWTNPIYFRLIVTNKFSILKNFSTTSSFYARPISMDNRHVNPLQAIGQITQFDPGSFSPFHENPKSDI